MHHPVAVREVASPQWLVVPELGLYTGTLICGAIGSGKTSACMRPFARQLFGWQAGDPERRIAGLVLEVKGDFCHQVRGILEDAGRGGDYIELGIGGRWQWNPLGDDELDSYSLAYTIASLINQLFGRSKEPFWQQAYVNLVRWIIELHRMSPRPWVTLRDVYRGTLDAELVQAQDRGGRSGDRRPVCDPGPDRGAVRADGRGEGLGMGAGKATGWSGRRTTRSCASNSRRPGSRSTSSGWAPPIRSAASGSAAVEALARAGLAGARPEACAPASSRASASSSRSSTCRKWRAVFCPPAPPAPPPPPDEAPAESAVDVVRPLPPLDEVIDSGKVLCLKHAGRDQPGALARRGRTPQAGVAPDAVAQAGRDAARPGARLPAGRLPLRRVPDVRHGRRGRPGRRREGVRPDAAVAADPHRRHAVDSRRSGRSSASRRRGGRCSRRCARASSSRWPTTLRCRSPAPCAGRWRR